MQQSNLFIGRQAVLDTKRQIIGYELLARNDGETQRNAGSKSDGNSHALVNVLSDGTEWLLGSKLAFINVTGEMLASEYLGLLPSDRVIFEIDDRLHTSPETLNRVKEWRGRGYRFALENFTPSANSLPFLPFTDIVKLDVKSLGLGTMPALVQEMTRLKIKKLAVKVETNGEFAACQKLGSEYFQGSFFTIPETLSAKVLKPGLLTVIDLLNKLRANADLSVIEQALKRDVALSYKLLRYINSAGFGLSTEIQSFRHAVTILGYQNMYRWLALLLVTAGREKQAPATMGTALVRGRMAELLGRGYLNAEEASNLFVVGVFSLLDVLLEMPIEKVLDSLQLAEPIRDALLSRDGIYGPFLRLAEACESPASGRIEEVALELAMSPETANRAHFEALAWVEKLAL